MQHGLSEAVNFKQEKKMFETMSSLNFDNWFVEKIYDDKEHTLLDFFFQNKPNMTFNQYLNNIQTNESQFKEFISKAKASPRNELSEKQKAKYEALKQLENQRILEERALHSKSCGRPSHVREDASSLLPVNGTLNPYNWLKPCGKKVGIA